MEITQGFQPQHLYHVYHDIRLQILKSWCITKCLTGYVICRPGSVKVEAEVEFNVPEGATLSEIDAQLGGNVASAVENGMFAQVGTIDPGSIGVFGKQQKTPQSSFL